MEIQFLLHFPAKFACKWKLEGATKMTGGACANGGTEVEFMSPTNPESQLQQQVEAVAWWWK